MRARVSDIGLLPLTISMYFLGGLKTADVLTSSGNEAKIDGHNDKKVFFDPSAWK